MWSTRYSRCWARKTAPATLQYSLRGLSSPLISRKIKQGGHNGTIAGHIEDAVRCVSVHLQQRLTCSQHKGHLKEMLLAKARWLFPLYGDKPSPHWVLGWADLTASQLHIFDSVPELESYMWAEPVGLFHASGCIPR